MCQQHKNQIAQHPESAVSAWLELMARARSLMDMREWQLSIIAYGNALGVAEVIFANNPNSFEVNRYIRTAVEFIYILRASQHSANINELVESMSDCLQKQLYPAHIELLLRPIKDIAYQPLPQMDRWMNALFLEDEKKNHSIH